MTTTPTLPPSLVEGLWVVNDDSPNLRGERFMSLTAAYEAIEARFGTCSAQENAQVPATATVKQGATVVAKLTRAGNRAAQGGGFTRSL